MKFTRGILGVALVLMGCLDSVQPGPVAELHILAVGDTLRGLGRTYGLHAIALDANGNVINDLPVEWESSNPAVAAVGSDGQVQTVSTGSTIISATAGAAQSTAQFLVSDQAGMVATAKGPICAIDEEGTAYCWGAGFGPLVLTDQPMAMSTELVFHSVSGGWAGFVCGLTTGGVAYCWGQNTTGGLGDGTLVSRGVPTPVSGELLFRLLRSAGTHSCGITQTSEVYCWGFSQAGQVGSGATEVCAGQPCSLDPVRVDGDREFRSLSLSSVTSCGLEESGDLYCWGALTSRTPVTTPQHLVPGFRFKHVASANFEQCGIEFDGQTYCWPVFIRLSDPAPIGGPELEYISDAVGGHFCGLDPLGSAFCWGSNGLGQLGIGEFSDTLITTPVPVVGGLNFTSIAAGDQYTCAMTEASEVYCWGFNQGNEGIVDPSAGEPCPSFPTHTCYLEPRLTGFRP